jgi:DNA segregation ATPase FtsK/SpoIIIE-like protein
VAGSTGWGKSGFVGSLLFQIATAAQSTEFVLIDQQQHGLSPFRNCNRLRYPLLSKPGEILSALHEVHAEAIGKRSELFRAVDADDLEHYNSIADEPLPPIIVGVDEASALLADKEIGAELKRHAWELRKFGVYQFLMLTSAKGTTIDTDHRQQFASKIQLHAADNSQARLLMNAQEAVTFPKGRAMIELPGQHPTIVQCPFMDRREIKHLLPTGTPMAMPQVIEVELSEGDRDATFKRLVSEGSSRRQASLEAYGKPYAGATVERGRRVLGEV